MNFGRPPALRSLRAIASVPMVVLLALSLTAPAPQAQLTSAAGLSGAAPSVFLDCQGGVPCNPNHFRTEIQFVNWARDRTDADVHVIVTGETVGGGGRRYTLEFIGRGAMAHLGDRLTYTAGGTDVQRETQDGLTQALRLGLLRYAVDAGLGRDFDVRFTRGVSQSASGNGGATEAPRDPWNYWTFRVGFSGNMSVTETRSNYRTNPSFSADRVTDDWKLNFNFFSNLRWERIVLSSGRVVRNDATNWSGNTILVHSLTPRLSSGIVAGAGSSVAGNTRTRVTMTPAVEWNYYPYLEASRRQLITHYGVGMQYSNYRERTSFGVDEESVPLHRFGMQYRTVAPWGNAGVGIDASQYLHESGLYNVGASGNVSFRVLRGLELYMSASGNRVADQIHVPAAEISEEDILLGRQSLPTGYDYQAAMGLTFRWGSAYSNIVNVRFPPSVR
jgi:hypothetical protein